MPQHETPQIMKDYFEKQGPKEWPQICHTCLFYDKNGVCEKYEQQPPREFSETHRACEDWEDNIPF